jgi:dCMP deaminase
MDTAYRFAELSTARRAKVGAIVVKDERIISIGYNGMPSGWDNCCEDELEDGTLKTKPQVLHAEANAIAKLAQSPESAKDAVLFCTHMPCMECAKLIYQSGIRTVYYGEQYVAAKGSGEEFLNKCDVSVEQVK